MDLKMTTASSPLSMPFPCFDFNNYRINEDKVILMCYF